MNKSLLTFTLLLLMLGTGLRESYAQNNSNGITLDQIVAVVNDHIILKSDVDQQVTEYMMQMKQQSKEDIKFGKDIWYTVLQNMVDRFVMLDKAKLDSVTVTDDQVDQQIDQRINQYVQQLGSESALEKQLGKSIVQIKSELRQNYRDEMIVGQYTQQKMSDIDITRPEVKEYFASIPDDSLPNIPERVALSQIVAIPPPLKDAQEKAHHLAEELRDSILHHDKSIEELAKKYSDGPSGPYGGKVPLMPMNDLVPEYSAAAAALQPGEISEVVKTAFGYHIIRLNKRVGDKIDTNQILIEIDKSSYNDQEAIDKLNQLKDSVLTEDKITFAEMARKYSEDSNTAPQGGKLLNPQTGDRYLVLSQLDPALYRIVLLLDNKDEISAPKQYNIGSSNNAKRAFRIVRLDQQIPEHIANLKQDFDRIKNYALQQKRFQVRQRWLSNLKKDVYIEYKIQVPDQYKNS